MMSALASNALAARRDQSAIRRAAVVTGDDSESGYWMQRFSRSFGRTPVGNELAGGEATGPLVLVERGRRGNLFGTLAAYQDVRTTCGTGGDSQARPLDQLIMLLGTGSRLSPFTQALRNIKAAFPLPDIDSATTGVTVGEAAIRAGAPLVAHLGARGFRGVLVRWGDEIQIPTTDFHRHTTSYLDTDVVRFGSRADPTEQLASQKEWLLIDDATQLVIGELSRQPLPSLRQAISRVANGSATPYVNLGSFAATPAFLEVLIEVLHTQLRQSSLAANWDPYFWMAFYAGDEAGWSRIVQAEVRAGGTGLQDLLAAIPDFFALVRSVRTTFEHRVGRPIRIKLLDFGVPYWIDAGDHVGLHRMFADIFRDAPEGDAIRAFLGIPDQLLTGSSIIRHSEVPADAEITGSVVIGARIREASSRLAQAIVLGGDYGHLQVDPGGVAIQSISEDLTIAGSHAVAFRLREPTASVAAGESRSTVLAADQQLQMRYLPSMGTIGRELYDSAVAGNPVSYREAANVAATLDPLLLDAYWAQRHLEPTASSSGAPPERRLWAR